MNRDDMRYSIIKEWSDEDRVFIVTVPELPGCKTHGATYEESVQQGQDSVESWLDGMRALGRPVPKPRVAVGE